MGLNLQPARRMGGKIATLIAVFALIVQPMYGLVANNNTNALGALANELKASPLTTTIEVQTGVVEVSAKAIVSGFLGWTNAQSLANTTSVTASVDPSQGLLASSCTADDWASSITKNIQPGRDIEGKFCFKSNSIGDHTINFSTTIARVDNGSPKILNNSAVVSVRDTTPPETTLTAPSGLAGNEFTVSGVASDNMALNHVFIQLVHRETGERYGESTINLIPQGAGPYAWSQSYNATSLNLPEGTYAAHVQAVDMSNNRTDVGWSDNFTLDKTAPSFEILLPINGSTVRGQEEVSVHITDSNNIKKVLLNVGDGHGNYSWEVDKSDSKITREGDIFKLNVDTTKLADGINHVVVRATDGAGNTKYYNNRKDIHNYTVDNSGPSITLKNPADNQIIGGKHKISAEVTDTNGVDTSTVYARFKNSAGKEFTYYLQQEGDSNTYSLEVDTTEFVPQGEALTLDRVSFRAVDTLGNPRSSISSDVAIDNQNPIITVKDGFVGNKNIHTFSNVSFELHDSVMADKYILNEGTDFEHISDFTNDKWSDANFDNIKAHLIEGQNTITLYDVAGNSTSYSFVFDSKIPLVKFVNAPGYTNNPAQKFNLTATDEGTGLRNWSVIFLDENDKDIRIGSVPCIPQVLGVNASATCYANTDLSKFISGKTYTARAKAIDKANNEGYAEHTFVYDTNRPTINLSTNHNGLVSGYNSWKDARNVLVTVTDNNIGETSLHRDSDDSLVTTYNNDGTEFSIGMGLPEGVYYLIHTDQANNESAKRYFTISNKKPSIYDIEGLKANDSTVVGPEGITTKFKAGNGDSLAATVDQVMVRGWVYDESKSDKRGAAAFSNQVLGDASGSHESNLAALLGDKYVHGAKFVIMLQARNTANVHDQHTFTLEVDLQAPAVAVNSYAQPFTTDTPTIEGTVDDDADTVEVSLDGGITWEAANYTPGQTTWSFTYSPALANGNHTIQVRATDKAGNVGNSTSEQGFATATFEVKVDAPAAGAQTIQDPLTTPASAIFAVPGIFNPAIITLPATDESAGTVESATGIRSNEARGETNSTKTNGEVLAAENSKQNWSIVNLLLAVGVVLASIIALLGIGRKENRRIALRALSVVPAVGAVALLLSAENFSEPVVIANSWSWLMAAIALAQIVIVTLARKTPSSIE